MASLTGNTIQSTYDSLLKVTDNDSITGSLKRITDGLGNNTPLYLSSSAVEIVSTLNITSTITASNLSGTNTGDETKASIETKLGAATSSNSGYLTSTDWSTFNNKIAGTGTLNQLAKFSSSSSIANSIIFDNGTNVGIGTATPGTTLDVYKASGESGVQISSGAEYARLFYRDTDDNFGVFINGLTRLRLIGSTGNGALLESGTGNLAIGTTAATASTKLWVAGTGYFSDSVGIGSTSLTVSALRVAKPITGGTTAYGVYVDSAVQSDVTSVADGFRSAISFASGTLTDLAHYRASGAGLTGTVTNQYGFTIGGNLINATNNYGFHSTLAAGTGRWNLYMAGTANNYLAGALGIGSTSLTGVNLAIGRNLTGAVTVRGINQNPTIQSDVTNNALLNSTSPSTAAATFTLPAINHYHASQGTFGAGSTVTNQFGFQADSTLIGATNNYGFRGAIPSGTNRWNLYMDGTANNFIQGALGIGSTTLTGINVNVSRNITGSTVGRGVYAASTIQSDVTAVGLYFSTDASTQATTFTLGNLRHYQAAVVGFGAGSTVTNQVGFYAAPSVVGATNNYGFQGSIPSGTGRWNLYMDGTANNYLSGNLGIGATNPGQRLQVGDGTSTGSQYARFFHSASDIYIGQSGGTIFGLSANSGGYVLNDNASFPFGIGTTQSQPVVLGTANTERMRISSGGNVGIGTTNPYARLMVQVAASASDVHALEITNATDASFAVYLRNNITSLSAGGAGNMVFSNSAERMRIASDGAIQMRNVYNRQTASYTLVLGDAGKIVEMNVAGTNNNVTVPPNSSVAYPIGTEIFVTQYGSGQTSLVAGAGVTIRSDAGKLTIANQYKGACLVKVGTDEWYLIGSLK